VKIIDKFEKITGEIVGRIFCGKNLNKYKMHDQQLTLAQAHLLNYVVVISRRMSRLLHGDKLFMNFPKVDALIKKVKRLRSICLDIIT